MLCASRGRVKKIDTMEIIFRKKPISAHLGCFDQKMGWREEMQRKSLKEKEVARMKKFNVIQFKAMLK